MQEGAGGTGERGVGQHGPSKHNNKSRPLPRAHPTQVKGRTAHRLDIGGGGVHLHESWGRTQPPSPPHPNHSGRFGSGWHGGC